MEERASEPRRCSYTTISSRRAGKGNELAMTNDIQRLIDSEQRLARAHLLLETDVVESLLHEDYVIVQPGGVVETRSDVLASLRSGTRVWRMAAVDELEVKCYGDCARVVGRWTAAGTNQGTDFDYQARFISVWIRQCDTWQNLSYSSAEITG